MTGVSRYRNVAIVLTVIGLIDALYLTVIKFSNSKSLCLQGVGDCWSVNTSRFSEIYGIPVSILGAGAYFLILILLLLEAKGTFWKTNSPLIVFGLSLAGVLYSAYLTYLEIAVIRAICPFCVISAVVMLAIFVISTIRLVNPPAETILD